MRLLLLKNVYVKLIIWNKSSQGINVTDHKRLVTIDIINIFRRKRIRNHVYKDTQSSNIIEK